MTRKTYSQLAAEAAERVEEILPWEVPAFIEAHPDALLLDIRERGEVDGVRIAGALNVPRGILESAAEWGYPETEPALVTARDKPVLIICRSGNRSAFAAERLMEMGFADVRSVKLGVRGWNDAELELLGATGTVLDDDAAAELIDPEVSAEKMGPGA